MNRVCFLFLICISFLTFSCSNSPCKIEERTELKMTGNEKPSSSAKDLTSRVYVYKADGSLQCGLGQKISLDDMKKDLGNITVFSAINKHDSLMRPQVCGAPTGTCNVYEIDQKDLDLALKSGFKKWTHN